MDKEKETKIKNILIGVLNKDWDCNTGLMKIKTTLGQCTKCGGSGHVQRTHLVDCAECDGKGYIF